MRKFLFLPIFALIFNLSLFSQGERITAYDVIIEANSDRSIEVVENIEVYAMGNQIKRGITRNFPPTRDLNGRNVSMNYKITSIKKNGIDEPYFTRDNENGYTIYIGEESVYLPEGTYTYTIQYTVPNQVGFYTDFDEIYWNAIGTDVEFEVDKASCRVILPPGARVLQEKAYTGKVGSIASDYTSTAERVVHDFRIDKPLGIREGFTVALGVEKGVFKKPNFLHRYGPLLLILLGLGYLLPYYYITWDKYGRDPEMPEIKPTYSPPEDLSPGATHYIFYGKNKRKNVTASLVDLAIKGYLHIEEIELDGIIVDSKKYVLHKLRDSDSSLPPEQKVLHDGLFGYQDSVTIDGQYASSIESTYNSHKQNLANQYHSLIVEGNNSSMLFIPILVSTGAAALALFIYYRSPYAYSVNSSAVWIFVVIAVICLFVYNYLIKKPTVEKLDLLAQIKGFRRYMANIQLADQPVFEDMPLQSIEHYEEILPYAFALGVAGEWSNKFKDYLETNTYDPSWNNHMGMMYFSNQFDRNFSSNMQGSVSPPSSSGGGSSGGGFSGGGGGGGGVGGW